MRAGLGALGSTPVLCKRIQNSFRSASLLAELDDTIAAEIADVDALSDIHTSADYRRRLAAVCLSDCVRELVA